jgi:Ca2+-binding EF-hand superfamily protein/mono/diheme cytochrome c family protein
MKRFLLITSVLAVAAFALIVRAQTTELKARFDAYDINKDGEISGDEMQAAPILPKLDLDADGKLTLIEAAKALRQKIPEATPTYTGTGDRRLFDFLDKDKDGKLTAEEMPKKQWFDRLDTNSDGSITFEEADSVVAQMKARGESIPRIPGAPESPAAPASEPKTEDLTESPLILKGSDHGVGHLVTDLALGDKKLSAHLTDSKGAILAFFGATCPISGKLGPELARLEKDASAQQVRMILVCPVASETADDIQKFVTTHALKSPVVHDKDGLISAALTATTTTEVFLIDSARTLTYRGAINDQYGLGYTKEQPTKTYLRDAMVAMLASTATKIAATTAPGCAMDLKKATSIAQTSVTYHHQIERIMQANCLECHRKGSVGPFSLESYEDVIENAGMIRKQVERGVMPPWFAAEPPAGQDTLWINDCSLSKQDKSDLLTWLASDRPKGNSADAPAKLVFPEQWVLGEPDAIVQLPRAVSIKAEGTMPYQFLTADTDFPEDRWVSGYEILPTDPSVVHHVIVQVHKKGSKARDRGEGAEGYWAAYVPGNTHNHWPEGFAKKLPAGATISFQIHYTPNGKATQDQLKIGLHFAKETPRYIVHTAAVANTRLSIPAGAANHVEVKEQTVPFDMNVLAYMAHMHVRGKAFKFEVTKPDGSHEVLLDIPRYDFNWQLRYNYAQSRFLPRGSKVTTTAIFDNSDKNPANPDPTKTIRWGQQTFDEMMIGYIEYYTPYSADVAVK